MPAARTKQDLIAICDRDFAKLAVLLDGLSTRAALAEDADGWSVRDVIAHRAHRVHLTLGWVRDGRLGLEPEIPAPGYKWTQLRLYDLELRKAARDMAWPAARAALRGAHLALMREIDAMDDTALYGGPMPGARSPWPAGRWFEACGARHYRSATRFVRARIRLQTAAAEERRSAA